MTFDPQSVVRIVHMARADMDAETFRTVLRDFCKSALEIADGLR